MDGLEKWARVGLLIVALNASFSSEDGRLLMVYSNYDESIDYGRIKQMAKEQGVSVNDLIVLAPQNDPFYTGTPGDQTLGEWFAHLWYSFGETRAHIRRIHYQIVARANITFPNGRPYENTTECWEALNVASKAARYLRLVDPEAFNDRRTPEVRLFAPESDGYPVPSARAYNSIYSSNVSLPDFPQLPTYSISGYEVRQRYHLEVWCEKSTMNDILVPLCESYGANLQTGMGEMSITATLALVRRLEQAAKPARILYVSDFDPAGQSMPVAASRKIEYFVRTLGLDLDVRVFPVVLTLDQVQHYGLPRTPIKETERRREGFEQRHGAGAVELDALEALYPGELSRVLGRYVEYYYDTSLEDRVYQQIEALKQHLGGAWRDITNNYSQDIQALRREYDQLQADFGARMSGYGERVRSLWQAIRSDLNASAPQIVDQYPLPGPYEGYELGDGLYNSERDYLEQLEAYKLFQGKM